MFAFMMLKRNSDKMLFATAHPEWGTPSGRFNVGEISSGHVRENDERLYGKFMEVPVARELQSILVPGGNMGFKFSVAMLKYWMR